MRVCSTQRRNQAPAARYQCAPTGSGGALPGARRPRPWPASPPRTSPAHRAPRCMPRPAPAAPSARLTPPAHHPVAAQPVLVPTWQGDSGRGVDTHQHGCASIRGSLTPKPGTSILSAGGRLQGRVVRVRHGEQELERAQAPHAQLPVVARRGQPALPEHDHRSDARAVLCRPARTPLRRTYPGASQTGADVLAGVLRLQQKGRASGACSLTRANPPRPSFVWRRLYSMVHWALFQSQSCKYESAGAWWHCLARQDSVPHPMANC